MVYHRSVCHEIVNPSTPPFFYNSIVAWRLKATRRYSKHSKRGIGGSSSLENLHHYLRQYKGNPQRDRLTVLVLSGLRQWACLLWDPVASKARERVEDVPSQGCLS